METALRERDDRPQCPGCRGNLSLTENRCSECEYVYGMCLFCKTPVRQLGSGYIVLTNCGGCGKSLVED